MSQNVRRFDCPPQAVFDVLADGWLYAAWVVGASRMRAVDPDWPAAGSRLHHSVGAWPLVLDDTTSSRAWAPPERAAFRARGWPIGEADVVIEVRASGGGCLVRITERPAEGPGRYVPALIREPLMRIRNRETLRRLSHLAEGRWRVRPHAVATTGAGAT
ncbi:hypothetical protein BCL57_002881 [Agromyces flavus]|uniref:Polyketide cyclase / dehydrase and lipid transport n=1 Tax=Agromyces flavus TaxID=589382 RepID=A0A1H1M3K6_9MICO|nr:SRPBCC family protein [Agromyces flavus]MCP2368705.1 hypothetical protein [Agromyces flavus]GGI48056.1 polyketide cyclase [Agromyces flavus]SDR81240.1 Polyketide cyclase / dehydrase and lipid transport [Agromyces flavus]